MFWQDLKLAGTHCRSQSCGPCFPASLVLGDRPVPTRVRAVPLCGISWWPGPRGSGNSEWASRKKRTVQRRVDNQRLLRPCSLLRAYAPFHQVPDALATTIDFDSCPGSASLRWGAARRRSIPSPVTIVFLSSNCRRLEMRVNSSNPPSVTALRSSIRCRT